MEKSNNYILRSFNDDILSVLTEEQLLELGSILSVDRYNGLDFSDEVMLNSIKQYAIRALNEINYGQENNQRNFN